MRATPLHPRQLTALLLLALALAVTLALAAAPDLEPPSLSLGSQPATTGEAPTPARSGTPAWVSDPMRPPLEALERP